MKNEEKITLSEWNLLNSEQKEILQMWAVKHKYELDLVPGSAGSFDPSCDYAALLTNKQMILFLQEHNQNIFIENKEQGNPKLLWNKLLMCLR